MNYRYQKPPALLSAYVRTVLILEGFSQPDAAGLPLFTNGMPALICRTEKDPAGTEQITRLCLFGKSVSPYCWATNTHTTIIAFFFKPFAMAGIFNIPAARLAKAPVDLCNWSPHKTNALRTQLAYARSTDRKIAILDNLLIQQWQQQKRACEIIQYATDQVMCNPGKEILPELLKTLNLTERTFQRIFKKYVGITPVQYRRICQFQLSFAQLKSQQFNTLADVAYDNGFADQSHFTRSFREFTNSTPNNYLRSGLKGKNQ